MRAFAIDRYSRIEDASFRELPDPSAAAGQVRVRVHAAAVNPADVKVITGRDGGRFLHAPRFPLVPGFDFSGAIDQVGAGVDGWSEGDAVFGFLPYARSNRQGSFAELVVVEAGAIGRKPAQATHAEAASAATVASTALQAMRDKARLRQGARVLINGASGGVGSYGVQIAKRLGAEVWGTCSAARIEHVEALGADRALDYRALKISDLDARFDVILDAAATASFGACRPVMSPGAGYVTTLPTPATLAGFLASLFSSQTVRFVVVKSRCADLDLIADWIDEGAVASVVDRTYPFEALPDALQAMAAGGVKGKIAVQMAPG